MYDSPPGIVYQIFVLLALTNAITFLLVSSLSSLVLSGLLATIILTVGFLGWVWYYNP